MRYHYQENAPKKQKKSKKSLFVLPLIAVVAGGYGLITAFSPMLAEFPGLDGSATKARLSAEPGAHGNRLYIPQLNVDMAILKGDSESVLERGAWHRDASRGNPADGGNFILSANRFGLGMTPGETRMQSPLYNINKLEAGQQIFVDYEQRRYGYEITKKIDDGSNLREIETSSDEPRLTLYPWKPDATDAVIIAKPLGVVEKLELKS